MNAREIGEQPAYAHAQYNGLTQRQAYKIAAMQGYLSSTAIEGCRLPTPEECANFSAQIADAMLAEDSEHLGRQG